MLTVTITGERAEGKTVLALIIAKLLKALTNYQIEVRETNSTRASSDHLERHARSMKLEDLKKLKARNVAIVVVNTDHYNPKFVRDNRIPIDFGDL